MAVSPARMDSILTTTQGNKNSFEIGNQSSYRSLAFPRFSENGKSGMNPFGARKNLSEIKNAHFERRFR